MKGHGKSVSGSGNNMHNGVEVGSEELTAVPLGWSLECTEIPAWEDAVGNTAKVGSQIGLDPKYYGKLLKDINQGSDTR